MSIAFVVPDSGFRDDNILIHVPAINFSSLGVVSTCLDRNCHEGRERSRFSWRTNLWLLSWVYFIERSSQRFENRRGLICRGFGFCCSWYEPSMPPLWRLVDPEADRWDGLLIGAVDGDLNGI